MASEVTLGSLASFTGYDEVPEEWVPAQGKFKAIIFDTVALGPPEVREFDCEFDARSTFAPQPCYARKISPTGNTALVTYVFNDQGVCVMDFGSFWSYLPNTKGDV